MNSSFLCTYIVMLFIYSSLCESNNKIKVTSHGSTYEIELKMPNVVSTKSDDLICHSFRLDSTRHQYILEYKPDASRSVAHHMMIYGCKTPGSLDKSWLCGGRERSEKPVCGGGSGGMEKRIVYAWALDAPEKKLPIGVGLRVGGDTNIQYMVLQLHYKKKFKGSQTDSSGVVLKMTYKQQLFQMGFYILGNYGYIPPKQSAFYMESACQWRNNETIYPFSYRTHSHNLGKVTSAYRIRNSKWTEIGRMSPQQPEMFYEVTKPGIDIRTGDILAARCTMHSSRRNTDTIIGATNHDEMCNFYFMYYTNSQRNLEDIYCFRDAQSFHWKDYFDVIPDRASSLEEVKLMEPDMELNEPLNMR